MNWTEPRCGLDDGEDIGFQPLAAVTNPELRKKLHADALAFPSIAGSKSNVIESIDELLRRRCCVVMCCRDLSWSDCAVVRGRLVQLLQGERNRTSLRDFVRGLLMDRLSHDSHDDKFVLLDTRIAKKTVCVSLFLRVLGIGVKYFKSSLVQFKTGNSLISSTSNGKNYLHINTIKAIARISVEIKSIGQFNPNEGHVILPRATSKKEFARTNEATGYLHQRNIRLFVGVGTRKRGAIDFLTCTVCRTLSAQLQRLEIISSIMRSEVGLFVPSVRKTVPDMIAKHLRNCRKAVLMSAHKSFRSLANSMAKARGVDPRTIHYNDVVRDCDVEDEIYLGYLNDGLVSLTIEAVKEMEAIHAADAETRYVLSETKAGRLLPVASRDELIRKNVQLDTSAAKVRALMDVHHQHVVQERLLVEVANEMSATYPNQVLALQYDGCGKDKTKIPSLLEKDKNFCPAEALMCPVYTWQIAVPSQEKGISKYKLKNFPYVIPFSWCGVISTDVLVSTLLDLLMHRIETSVPPIITIVLDNAYSNKSMGTLQAFAFVMEQIPELREIHLYFPTVGHTHGTVDQHFSIISKRIRSRNVLTVQDLLTAIQCDDAYTVPVTKFALYAINKHLAEQGGPVSYSNLVDQHYFLLFKDPEGRVVFNHDAFMRFAEPLSARVQYHVQSTRALLPLTEAERSAGLPVFPTLIDGLWDRKKLMHSIKPSRLNWYSFYGEVVKMFQLIPPAHLSARVTQELKDSRHLLLSRRELELQPRTNLGMLVESIGRKCGVVDSLCSVGTGRMGDRQENIIIAQRMRLLGKTISVPPLALNIQKTTNSVRVAMIAEVIRILNTVDPNVEKNYVDAVTKLAPPNPGNAIIAHVRHAQRLIANRSTSLIALGGVTQSVRNVVSSSTVAKQTLSGMRNDTSAKKVKKNEEKTKKKQKNKSDDTVAPVRRISQALAILSSNDDDCDDEEEDDESYMVHPPAASKWGRQVSKKTSSGGQSSKTTKKGAAVASRMELSPTRPRVSGPVQAVAVRKTTKAGVEDSAGGRTGGPARVLHFVPAIASAKSADKPVSTRVVKEKAPAMHPRSLIIPTSAPTAAKEKEAALGHSVEGDYMRMRSGTVKVPPKIVPPRAKTAKKITTAGRAEANDKAEGNDVMRGGPAARRRPLGRKRPGDAGLMVKEEDIDEDEAPGEVMRRAQERPVPKKSSSPSRLRMQGVVKRERTTTPPLASAARRRSSSQISGSNAPSPDSPVSKKGCMSERDRDSLSPEM